jgi:DivIVA domain-containing protein
MCGHRGDRSEQLEPLRAEDVRQVRFQATKFRQGYDQDHVDDFLDRVAAELLAAELLAEPRPAAGAGWGRFRLTGSEPGYVPRDVDEFLDRLAAQVLAAQVSVSRSRATKSRECNAQGDVNGFLDGIRQALQSWPNGAVRLTAEDVEGVRFPATKFREGYDQGEVDNFLDRVVAELRRRARR